MFFFSTENVLWLKYVAKWEKKQSYRKVLIYPDWKTNSPLKE